MSFFNVVRLQGPLKVRHVAVGKRGKYAFASVQAAEKTHVPIVAWEPSVAAGLEEAGSGAEVQVSGHIEQRKTDRTRTGKDGREYAEYETQIVADKVVVVAEPAAVVQQATQDNPPF